jgi:tetratricopeptide (TPR) repeat protein
VLVLAAILLGGARAAAQTPSDHALAALQGTLRDSQSLPIAGATLILQAAGAAKPLTAETDNQGAYAFPAVAAGTYSVHVEKSGFAAAAIPNVTLAVGERKRLDLVLEPSPPAARGAPTASEGIQFSDQPQFTVAGVTNWTYPGGYGSDSRLQASESLTQETCTLGAGPVQPGSAASVAQLDELLKERRNVRAALAHHETAELDRRLGDLDERLGDPLEAVGEYERAVRLEPSELNYFDWGSELLLHRASEPAVEVFTQGRLAYPRSMRMLMGLGVACYARGDYEQAVRWLSAAADLDPVDRQPYLFLGKMESASPTPLEGVDRQLERFLRLHPSDAWANYYASLNRWKRLRGSQDAAGIEQVKRLADRALELDPRLGEAWILRGNLAARAHDWNAAVRAYQQALQAAPQLEEPHYRLALAYRRMGWEADARRETGIYEQESRERDAQAEGRREEIRQFVIVWKGEASSRAPH